VNFKLRAGHAATKSILNKLYYENIETKIKKIDKFIRP
jgi:hypothetical protein